MFYRTDEHIDCTDNFSKLLSSANSVLAGEKTEYKWLIIYFFTFLQSLFIVVLSHGNKYSIIKRKYKSKTINNKEYIFKIDHSIETMNKSFNIYQKNDSIIICVAPFFGSEESIHKLTKVLKNHKVSITEKKIKDLCKQVNKLLSISKLFDKIKEIVTINEKIEQSFKDLIELRNDFIHFPPKTWSVEINLINTVTLHCSRLSLLLIKSNYIREYELDRNEVIEGLNKIIKGFEQSA